jgi:transglutaminase-like putative cysteine protease
MKQRDSSSPLSERDLGTRADGRYRVVDEERIAGNLVRNLFPYESGVDHDGALEQARFLLERWAGAGLRYRTEGGKRLFDACEACNFALQIWLDDGDPTYLTRQVASSRRMVLEMQALAASTEQFALTLRRDFNLRDRVPGDSLRLRMPLSIEAGDAIDAVHIDPDVATLDASVTRAPGRIDVRLAMPRPPLATLAIEATIRVAAQTTAIELCEQTECAPYDIASSEYRLYTRREEGLIRVSDAVVRLVNTLAGPAATPAQVVCAIWDYFVRRMRLSYIHYDELDPRDPMGTVIAREWADCHVGASLYASLARARGIPARVVTGAVLYPVAPGLHSWLEVLLPPHGWVSIDLQGVFLAARATDDSAWRRMYLGGLDPRLVMQRLPHAITGSAGVKVPADWYIAQRLVARGGCELTLGSLGKQQWLLRDTVTVATPSAA